MAAPDEYHPDAHAEAREITGERHYGEWGQCIATARSTGERCKGYAKGPHGKCRNHGGDTPTKDENPDVGAPEGNTNAVTHGMLTQLDSFYNSVADEDEQALIDAIFHGYKEMYADKYGEPPAGHVVRLWRIAVTMGQEMHGQRWMDEKPDGVHAGNALVDRERKITREGQPLVTYSTSVVLSAQKSLSNDARQWLKSLDLLPDPDNKQAEALGDLTEALMDNLRTSYDD